MPAINSIYLSETDYARLRKVATDHELSSQGAASGLIRAALAASLEPVAAERVGRPSRNTLNSNPVELALLKGPLTVEELTPFINGGKTDAFLTDMVLGSMIAKGSIARVNGADGIVRYAWAVPGAQASKVVSK